jgi:hypothetical protein
LRFAAHIAVAPAAVAAHVASIDEAPSASRLHILLTQRCFLRHPPPAVERLIRQELTLLRNLGRDRRLASSRLAPVIRSGPAAVSRPASLAVRKETVRGTA